MGGGRGGGGDFPHYPCTMHPKGVNRELYLCAFLVRRSSFPVPTSVTYRALSFLHPEKRPAAIKKQQHDFIFTGCYGIRIEGCYDENLPVFKTKQYVYLALELLTVTTCE